MKQEYIKADIEIVEFQYDIITTSGNETDIMPVNFDMDMEREQSGHW